MSKYWAVISLAVGKGHNFNAMCYVCNEPPWCVENRPYYTVTGLSKDMHMTTSFRCNRCCSLLAYIGTKAYIEELE